jgi:hypothetical protein
MCPFPETEGAGVPLNLKKSPQMRRARSRTRTDDPFLTMELWTAARCPRLPCVARKRLLACPFADSNNGQLRAAQCMLVFPRCSREAAVIRCFDERTQYLQVHEASHASGTRAVLLNRSSYTRPRPVQSRKLDSHAPTRERGSVVFMSLRTVSRSEGGFPSSSRGAVSHRMVVALALARKRCGQGCCTTFRAVSGSAFGVVAGRPNRLHARSGGGPERSGFTGSLSRGPQRFSATS